MPEFFMGVDLGQTHDRTAVVVVERVECTPPVPAPIEPPPIQRRRRTHFLLGQEQPMWPPLPPAPPPPKLERQYHVRFCERLRLGTPYPQVVTRVRWILDHLGSDAALVVDSTGIGRPVVDLFEASRVYPVAVTITAGETMARDGHRYRVPKRDLVTSVEVLLQERRLKIAQDIGDRAAMVDELLSFRASVTGAGRETFAAEGSAHDDLVIALALALWFARLSDTRPPGTPAFGISERWEDRDDLDALWLGDPEYRYLNGYRGGGSRFIGGGFSPSRRSPFRLR
jgi:hypothetical protein